MKNQGQDTPVLRGKIEAWAQEHLQDGRVSWFSEVEREVGATHSTAGEILFATQDGRTARTSILKDVDGNLHIGPTVEGGKPPEVTVASEAVHDALRADPPWKRP